MQFMIYCLDKEGAAALRAANRQAHLDYLKKFIERVAAAGPLLSDDGAGMIGTLLIMEFPDRAEAEAFALNDPYRQAGLFQKVVITPWRKVLP